MTSRSCEKSFSDCARFVAVALSPAPRFESKGFYDYRTTILIGKWVAAPLLDAGGTASVTVAALVMLLMPLHADTSCDHFLNLPDAASTRDRIGLIFQEQSKDPQRLNPMLI
jgi:hypothetical protein